jgi:NADH:ubiquinone oxidoreductase subunit 6 (subunit J)
MTTDESAAAVSEQTKPSTSSGKPGGSLGSWLAGIGLLAFVGLFLAVSRTALDPRVANPNTDGRPRPVEYLFGFDNWMWVVQIGTALLLVQLIVIFIIGWRRNPVVP